MERSLLGRYRAAWVTAPIHRNTAVGHRLEVGKIDTSEALSDSTVGSFFLGSRHGSRLGFRFDQQPTHTTCNRPFTINDSRVAQQLGLIATENGAAESSTLTHEQRESHDWKSGGPVIGAQRAKTGSTLHTRWRTIQSPAKPHHHVRSPSHEPSKSRPTSVAHVRWRAGGCPVRVQLIHVSLLRSAAGVTAFLPSCPRSVPDFITLEVPIYSTSTSQLHCFGHFLLDLEASSRGLRNGQLKA